MGMIKIKDADVNGINAFLLNAGSSLNRFRYFTTRHIDIIKGHLKTLLLFEDDVPIGYGHLEQEDQIVWLGIALSEKYIGLGYGKVILNELLKIAKENKIGSVSLSVDADNSKAIGLYERFGFIGKGYLKPNVILMTVNLSDD